MRRRRRSLWEMADQHVFWWILPLIAAAGVAGLTLQGFIAFLWIVAKEHVR